MEITIFVLLAVILLIVIIWANVKSRKKGKKLTTNIPKDILDEQFDNVIDDFVSGKMSNKFTTNLLLKGDERLIFDIPQIQLCEERSVKLGGGYGGVSVRVMKGVYARFGGFTGGIEKKVVPIDTGNFILTNKRVVYSGEKKSLDIPLQKINTIEPMDNGISLSRSGKTKMEYFVGTDVVEMSMTISPDPGETFTEEIVAWKLTGEEVRRMIQKLLR